MKSLEDEGIHREGEANLEHLEPLHVHGGVEVDIGDEEAGAIMCSVIMAEGVGFSCK